MRALVMIGVLSACGSGGDVARPQPSVVQPTAVVADASVDARADECATAALRLEVTPPAAGGPRATFSLHWKGEGSGERSNVICVISGSDRQLVPLGERREIAIRADARELQRIVVYDRQHLMFVPPGATISLGDHPCFFYKLEGPNTDAWYVDAPRAYCAKPGKPCKTGYVRANPPRPVEDELCGPTDVEILRCVAEAEVRLMSPVAASPKPREEDHLSLADLAKGVGLLPRNCGFAMVDTGREQVALAVGSGERWRLTLDGDRLVGVVE